MPDVRPFHGVRYDVAQVGSLSDQVAPPYDVIGPELQDRLYNASPYNVIRLELNREEAGDKGGDRYARAARQLREWLRAGVLRSDDRTALYAYHQTFQVDGQTHTRRGFMARVRLEPIGRGKIYPHEQTLSGPKADRLALYHATGFNLSPIFGLYPDPDGMVQKAIDAARGQAPLIATDHLGVENRLWVVTDPEVHTVISGMMSDKSIFIADGHHRYETGLKYAEEQTAKGETIGDDDPSHFCMMMLVGMSDPGLLILPTHRLVSGFPGLGSRVLAERLASQFEVRSVGHGAEGCQAAWDEIEQGGDQDLLGFGTVADGQWLVARLRSDERMDQLAPEHSPDWRDLGVSVLHVLVLGDLLAGLGASTCRYVHSLAEVEADRAAAACDLVCLVPPARMDHVETIASRLETMPPKSTYFYPKLLTGLVLNPLRKLD